MFFLKKNVLTRLHTWLILIIKHMHFIKIKTTGIHVLHKLSVYNTIPHRSHRTLIGHVTMLFKNFDKFSSVLHFSTLKLLLFNCRKSLRFLAQIFWNSAFFPQKCAWKTQNADQKLSVVSDKEDVIQTLVVLQLTYGLF